MARNIIIMDSSASMRRIIRTMIQATVNDAVVVDAQNAEEAQGLLEDAHYHLILFSRESSSKKWLKFAQKRLSMQEGERTNFVSFSSRTKQEYIDELKRYGIEDHIAIPCAPNDLGEIITRICTPFAMRKARRYSLPDTTAILAQGSNTFPAEIINFSEGGVLCELDASAQLNWFMPVMIAMEFRINGAKLDAPGLYSVTRRLMVIESNPDYSPKRIRLFCKFISVPEESKKQLAHVFAAIEKQEGAFGNED